MRSRFRWVQSVVNIAITASMMAFLYACSSGGSGASDGDGGCDGSCVTASSFLTAEEVKSILAQAVAEARARSLSATVAVVDRVGNVLAVFRMSGADTEITISTTPDGINPIAGGLENVSIIPDSLAAIAKAITGAYLSTEGNAFTTRTASQIIQEHFNPQEFNQPGGPLFGVQFSQLPCSDINRRFPDDAGPARPGPKRSPLGLSADPGGLPLFKDGTPVGGVGVISDGVYSLDKVITDGPDQDADELIALAATQGFTAPEQRQAKRITVDGKTLRFTDASRSNLLTTPLIAPNFDAINGVGLEGELIGVRDYYDGGEADLSPAGNPARLVLSGTAFTTVASGIRADTLDFNPELDAFVLVDETNTERFRPMNGTDTPDGNAANALSAAEVQQILSSALDVANQTRAQIRRPLNSPARVTISVVDTHGEVLGIVRGRDAPIFGIDVSLQKARTATFFSGTGQAPSPAEILRDLPNPVYLDGGLTPLASPIINLDNYVASAQAFLGVPLALEAAGPITAFSDRAGGNLSRPFYPDGILGMPNGPFSKPNGQWSPFSTGLQLDIVYNAIIHHVGYVLGVLGADIGLNCTGSQGLVPAPDTFGTLNPTDRLRNGIQIFPGSVPIYRDSVLVGGIGVSGDGVDQDDLISFIGVHRASIALSGSINNAPRAIRADVIDVPGKVDLRFVNCPQAPNINNNDFEVCDGL